MKKLFAFFGLFLFTAAFFPHFASAQSTCAYGSTQARVHKDVTDPWKQAMTINLGERFEAAGFHNNTGVFASDAVIQVSGPGMLSFVQNGQQITPQRAGTYTIFVNTRNQFGAGCSEQASVTVISPVRCRYGSTQARMQRSFSDPWKNVIWLQHGNTFNVGSFHDTTGVFATDTTLQVTSPNQGVAYYSNGSMVSANQTGWYRLTVTTNNQSGPGCTENAWAWVF